LLAFFGFLENRMTFWVKQIPHQKELRLYLLHLFQQKRSHCLSNTTFFAAQGRFFGCRRAISVRAMAETDRGLQLKRVITPGSRDDLRPSKRPTDRESNDVELAQSKSDGCLGSKCCKAPAKWDVKRDCVRASLRDRRQLLLLLASGHSANLARGQESKSSACIKPFLNISKEAVNRFFLGGRKGKTKMLQKVSDNIGQWLINVLIDG
jgi:hypothetical protein